MAAVALRPNADPAAIIAEVNAIIATPAASGNVSGGVALRIIRGSVSSLGVLTAGEGFAVSRGGVGSYSLTYTVAFAAAPALVLTPITASRIMRSDSQDGTFAIVRSFTVDGVTAGDTAFHFVAVGLA